MIDQGYTLLDNLDWKDLKKSELDFHWMGWDQVKGTIDSSIKEEILNEDIAQQSNKLRQSGISEGSIRGYQLRTIFLQEGVKTGYNLSQLAKMAALPYSKDSNPFLDNMDGKEDNFSISE